MKKLMLLAGLTLLLTAGTASAQTSVQLSLGFGVPRPYVSGYVVVGRPYLRSVYRPYSYRPYRRVVVVDRRVLVVERGRNHKFHRRHHRHWDDD